MSQSPLTAKYRPQRFADVVGQELCRDILSRAAAEDRIAPAYLFSGTRGVGKTTLARIFAKAINCAHAPAPEPCNECSHCRQITRGSAVDVVEIDGASNRGIDDARRLKEDVGYAPMECRYKVFIIDEAHMLTKDAFNALLKTLEEPPRNVTFIMATTEPHKFPATIISRCQHYVFQRLSMTGLEAHLRNLLTWESVEFEPAAVSLVARRASGSVRDSMSILGQVLALGRGALRESDVRDVLGLAGQEVFFQLMQAVRDNDTVALCGLVRSILDQGLDMGFFLRELSQAFRNMFLVRQSGDQALPLLEMPEEDARRWLAQAEAFSAAHIHACWQMSLEGQRRVLTSLEPAMALELLLLNLASLPQLLDLENLSAPSPAATRSIPAQPRPASTPQRPAQPAPAPAPQSVAPPAPRSYVSPSHAPPVAAPRPAPAPRSAPDAPPWEDEASPRAVDEDSALAGRVGPSEAVALDEPEPRPAPKAAAQVASPEPPAPTVHRPRTVDELMTRFIRAAERDMPRLVQPLKQLRRAGGELEGATATLRCDNGFVLGQLTVGEAKAWLDKTVRELLGPEGRVEVATPEAAAPSSPVEARKKVENEPIIQELQQVFDARIIS